MTHARALDDLGDLDEVLLVLGSILASNEDLDGHATPLDLVEIFGYSVSASFFFLPSELGGTLRTFLCRSDDVDGLQGEQHQCRRKLVTKQPELGPHVSTFSRAKQMRNPPEQSRRTCMALFL